MQPSGIAIQVSELAGGRTERSEVRS